jgi:hypothetical protein
VGFWDFHQTGDGHWRWRYVSDEASLPRYGACFRSRNDCIADAMRNGYLADASSRSRASSSPAPARQDLQSEMSNVPFFQRLLPS